MKIISIFYIHIMKLNKNMAGAVTDYPAMFLFFGVVCCIYRPFTTLAGWPAK